jgi:hypothetical protein
MADDAVIRLGYDNSKVRAGAKETQSIMQKTAGTVSKSFAGAGAGMSKAFAAIGGTMAIRGFAAEMGAIDDMSKRLGVSAESVQRVGNAAQLAGTDIDTVAKLMTKLTIASTDSAEKFEALGISAAAFANANLEDQVLMLAKAYEGANGDQGKMIKLMDLLGARGQQVLPLLSEGYADLAEQIKNVSVVNNAAVKSAAEFDDQYDAAIMTAKSFFGSIVSGYEDAIYYASAYKMQLQGLGDAQKLLQLREEQKAKKADELKKKAQDRVKAEVEESKDDGKAQKEQQEEADFMKEFRFNRAVLREKGEREKEQGQGAQSAFDGKRRKIMGYQGGSSGRTGPSFNEFFHAEETQFGQKSPKHSGDQTFDEFFHPRGRQSAMKNASTTNTRMHQASAAKPEEKLLADIRDGINQLVAI